MSFVVRQWDVVRIRINPNDRDEHPAVVLTCDEFCTDERRLLLNVLYGTTRRPTSKPEAYEITLNGADGLDNPTLFQLRAFLQR